jgi:hypothetical protein
MSARTPEPGDWTSSSGVSSIACSWWAGATGAAGAKRRTATAQNTFMAASSGSIALTPATAPTRSATSAPASPAKVPTPAIWP